MDKFEEKLINLKIPEISDKYLEYDLKERLEKKLFYNKFKLPYQLAFGSAIAMFILTISFVVNPDIANKINYAFSGKSPELIAESSQTTDIEKQEAVSQEWKGFEGLAELDKKNEKLINEQSRTVTDENGEIKTIKYLNPDDFEEGKVYMIRKYKSQDQEGIIMINEIENRTSAKGVLRKM